MAFNVVSEYLHCNMPFSSKDKAVIKNLYQFKENSLHRILAEFSKANCKRERLGTLLKRYLGNTKHRPKA